MTVRRVARSNRHVGAWRSPFSRGRAGSLLTELAMSMVMLVIAMTLTVKVLGYVAHERRAAEAEERALVESANVMERITAHDFDEVTPDFAKQMALSKGAKGALYNSELAIEVTPTEPAGTLPSSEWRFDCGGRLTPASGKAPVRLTAWIERRSPAK